MPHSVVGAGLVGLTATIALSRLPNVVVQCFERSPGPREIGAWISLHVSGLTVLDKLIDLDKIQNILYRGNQNSTYVHRHWRTGEVISLWPSSPRTPAKYVQGRTHRVPLLMTLHEHVPEGIINYNHHVDSVKVADDGVEINFKSQPTQKVDLLVAADGLYSRTRKQYIPDDAVLYRGLVAYRAVFPETLVSHISDLPNDTSVYRRNGENVFLSRIGLGQYGIVALIRETPDLASSLTWARSIGGSGMDRIRSHFASWDPVVTSVLAVVPDFAAYPLESAAWLEKLTRDDRIAFVGDAAHPTAGAFGAGTTVGFGDCWALMRALEHSSTTSNSTLQPYTSTATSARTTPAISHTYDLPCALRLYNETRCHFLARFQAQLMREVANVAYISEAGDEGPEWLARYQERFAPQWWLTEHDVEEEFRRTAEAADQVHEMVGQR